jgi:MioC protein
MESGRIQVTKPASFLKTLNILAATLSRQRKTHDYTHLTPGVNYVFEPTDKGDAGYMTGYGKWIQPGDSLLLCPEGEVVEYQVEEISYYANPSSMWMAVLTKIQATHNC